MGIDLFTSSTYTQVNMVSMLKTTIILVFDFGGCQKSKQNPHLQETQAHAMQGGSISSLRVVCPALLSLAD